MNKNYFYKNYFKLTSISNSIESFLKDYGIEDTETLKVLKKISAEIFKNKDKILGFLSEKTTEAFKDFSNSDLIVITLLNNYLKKAKRDISEYQRLTDEKEKKAIISSQDCPTLKKIILENKGDFLQEIIKQIAKVRVEIALIVRPKKDSLRILILKLILEILNSIIQYEKQFVATSNIDIELKKYQEEYNAYSELVDIDVVLDFKNFDASRWDKILIANIDNVRNVIIDIKKESKNATGSKLDDKSVILAINTLNNLHDLLTELKRIKDGPTFQKYFRDKYYKFQPPLVKVYNSDLNWVKVIDVLKKTGWDDLLSMFPRKIRKQQNKT